MMQTTLFNAQTSRWGHLVEPGISLGQQGLERHMVNTGSLHILEVHQGDTAHVISDAGKQPCQISFFNSNGQCDLGIVSDISGHPTMPFDEQALVGLKNNTRSADLQMRDAISIQLFQDNDKAGESHTFGVEANGYMVVAVPGQDMNVDGNFPHSSIEILIKRAMTMDAFKTRLPDPLADPLQDIRVAHSSAEDFEVRAGEYIQIIDVSGRQCSDFQGLSMKGLDQGYELDINHTTTRSLTGTSYPVPGLHSKFFNINQEPMFEVIRDTVGRHDTFGLACFARFYDQHGYPGHVNCTDNINAKLARYGVKPRLGWEAVNFFYNTQAEHDSSISFDEAWSRPGDYVLLRALTDSVCVATACPNDLDPANGWNPTDIHVRTYSDKKLFSKSVAIRMTPDSEPKLTQQSAFHGSTSQLTSDYVDAGGVWLPRVYNNQGAVEEYHACREAVMMMDLSTLRKFEIAGPDAEQLLDLALTRNIRKLSIGQVFYSAMCYETGGMIDDGTLFRLGDDLFRWVCADDYCGVWLRELAEKNNFKVWVKPSSDQLANLSIQGPDSRKTLSKFVWTGDGQTPFEELACFRFVVARIGDFGGIPILVSRTGYTGELGYEIFCHPKHAEQVWNVVAEAGEEFQIKPFGFDALEIVRIEAGLIMAGHEFDDTTDPFEAGIGFTVPLKSKTENFIGKEAIVKRAEHKRHALVGLELGGNERAEHGDEVYINRSRVGVITSGTRSPLLMKSIALCRMNIDYTELDTVVEVGKLDGHQKRITARVVQFPFYDPERTRLRS